MCSRGVTLPHRGQQQIQACLQERRAKGAGGRAADSLAFIAFCYSRRSSRAERNGLCVRTAGRWPCVKEENIQTWERAKMMRPHEAGADGSLQQVHDTKSNMEV